MDAVTIEQFLRDLGCADVVHGARVVRATCPCARWRHRGGTDRSRSFAVFIETGGAVSHCKCLACGVKGSLEMLLWEVASRTNRDLAPTMRLLQKHNAPSWEEIQRWLDDRERLKKAREEAEAAGVNQAPVPRREVAGIVVPTTLVVDQPPLPVLDESELDEFTELPPEVLDHLLNKRRLLLGTVEAWELRWHVAGQRIVIPIRDCEGRLVGISGRAYREAQRPKYLHSSGFRRDFYLYGEHRVRKDERGYLCEGFFDVMYLQQAGYNAVAMLGSYLSRFQIEKLRKFFTSLRIVPDGDQAGYEAAERISQMLSGLMPVSTAKVPEGKDPDELTSGEMIELL